ncbi:MAG TPA: H-X9-DG-CTERM domain-containing protein, partial [Gemmataceae bacterium]
LLPPNKACWFPIDNYTPDYGYVVSPASSWHSGGVNVVMADGSVHFVADAIDPTTWTALGTRAGGEPASLP